jgi:predicted nuclease with TOPRIM domain
MELEGHSHDYADEIASLSLALEEEQGLRVALEETHDGLMETHNLDAAKLKNDLEHALSLANDLNNKNDEFGVGHARLLEEYEKLEKDQKSLERKFSDLFKSYAQLQTQLSKELPTSPSNNIVDIGCSANPCCEHASLVEENKRLKA